METLSFAAEGRSFEGKLRRLEGGAAEFTLSKYQKVEGLARPDLRYAARNEGFGRQPGKASGD